MNHYTNRSSINPAIAATRALAKAKMGDREAFTYLVERDSMGDLAAKRALEDYHRHAIAAFDALIVKPN